MDDDKRFTILQAVPYLKREHDIDVTRMTVYNWSTKGRDGNVLKTDHTRLGVLYTTKGWIDDFVSSL